MWPVERENVHRCWKSSRVNVPPVIYFSRDRLHWERMRSNTCLNSNLCPSWESNPRLEYMTRAGIKNLSIIVSVIAVFFSLDIHQRWWVEGCQIPLQLRLALPWCYGSTVIFRSWVSITVSLFKGTALFPMCQYVSKPDRTELATLLIINSNVI